MVSRFTLDSATEFLLGRDVESLSVGLPYPYYADASLRNEDHPGNVFTHAFTEAQTAVATRVRFSSLWTLLELSGDKAKKHMDIIDAFIEPILTEAINKAKAEGGGGKEAEEPHDSEGRDEDTLLDHLVKYTSGMFESTPWNGLVNFCARSQDAQGRNSEYHDCGARYSEQLIYAALRAEID
jgi:hypothetical protein